MPKEQEIEIHEKKNNSNTSKLKRWLCALEETINYVVNIANAFYFHGGTQAFSHINKLIEEKWVSIWNCRHLIEYRGIMCTACAFAKCRQWRFPQLTQKQIVFFFSLRSKIRKDKIQSAPPYKNTHHHC